MPPAPSGPSISYGPSFVPAASAMAGDYHLFELMLGRNRHVGDYSWQVGQHPATALAPPLGRKTPIPLKWTAKLPGSLLGGNFTALPRIPLANLDIPEPKARQHAGKRLACIFVGDLQDAVLQCGCLKLALSFLAYLAFKIRIGRII